MRDSSTSSIDTMRRRCAFGIQRRVPAVLHRDARHVLLGHAVALHVAHRRHRQHVDRPKRQRTLVAGVPDLVQHRLRIAAFTDLVGAGGQHDVEHAGCHVIIRRRNRRDAGGTAVVDAQERLVASAHGVNAQTFGVADADHGIGRQRIHDSLDGIEVEAGILHRARDAFAHQLRIAGIVTTRAELRLADPDDADAIGAHGRASRASTTAAWYCMANPLPACASPQFAFAT